MDYEEIIRYMFASILAFVAAYGFINDIKFWFVWLIAALVYLGFSKLFEDGF